MRNAALSIALASLVSSAALPAAELPRPTPEQAAWQDLELGLFIHYDIPVFKPGWDHRQYESRPEPSIFHPRKLDTDQWMEAARAMGAKYAVFVAKHGSGFMCWQSDLYPYGMKQSPFRDGKGDIVRDFVASCRKYGIEPGIYAHMGCNGFLEVDNPGLVNRGKGGEPEKQARYARTCEGMLRELWGNYGELFEIWFDGGVLDPEKGGPDMLPILRSLQPRAIVFQGPAASIRWIGNEDGVAPDPCWATVPAERDYSGAGAPDGARWLPGECDVPIRRGVWLWEPGTEDRLFSVGELVDRYERSVGRNCNLLLNANPDPDGLIPEPDMRWYREFGDEIRRRFGKSVAETSGKGETVELALDGPARIDRAVTMEEIIEGERVRAYAIEGFDGNRWREICRGTSIGHKKIDRFPPVEASRVRWRCLESAAEPRIRRLAVYSVAGPRKARRPPSRDPIGHWTFDAVSDGKVPDSAPEPHPGAIRGAETAEGILGKALRFPGKDACVDLGDLDLFEGDFTVACWVKPAPAAGRERMILAKDRANVTEGQFRFYLTGDGRLGLVAGDAWGRDCTWPFETAGALPAGEWSHVAATREGRRFILHVGGREAARKDVEGTIEHGNDLHLLVGARQAAGDGVIGVFEGLIDDLRIHDRALEAGEVARLSEGHGGAGEGGGPIGEAELDAWSAPYRGWSYHPDPVIPSDLRIPGHEEFRDFDVPTVYQIPGRPGVWTMSFIGFDGKGYNSFVAESADLVHWSDPRLAMGFGPPGEFDHGGCVIGAFLYESYDVAAPRVLKKRDGRYWTLYGCYPRQGGYELRPGYEGVAVSDDGLTWRRAKDAPILSVGDPDCGAWEKDCVYQPWLVEDRGRFFDFYNAAEGGTEQMGGATSTDLLEWKRFPENPVIRVRPGGYDARFCSDGKVFRDGDHWTMFYFGVGKGGAHIMTAFSRDLRRWTSHPEPLYKAGGHPGGLDATYAHKISLLRNPADGRYRLYYCAVGNRGRCIGLLTGGGRNT